MSLLITVETIYHYLLNMSHSHFCLHPGSNRFPLSLELTYSGIIPNIDCTCLFSSNKVIQFCMSLFGATICPSLELPLQIGAYWVMCIGTFRGSCRLLRGRATVCPTWTSLKLYRAAKLCSGLSVAYVRPVLDGVVWHALLRSFTYSLIVSLLFWKLPETVALNSDYRHHLLFPGSSNFGVNYLRLLNNNLLRRRKTEVLVFKQ